MDFEFVSPFTFLHDAIRRQNKRFDLNFAESKLSSVSQDGCMPIGVASNSNVAVVDVAVLILLLTFLR
jgi:hypothetical protein